MATYVYRCDECKDEVDVSHRMNETPEVVCEKCNSKRRKIFVPTTAIVIGETFRSGRERVPVEVGKKLEEFKEHPEKDPYRKHRDKK